MNIRQAIKMAWKSIWGKKGRSVLTMLGIIIGIASVMTIVSVMNGMNEITMKQFEAMGRNRITVSVYSNIYDEKGNPKATPIFDDLYAYCNGLQKYILGVTPTGQAGNITMIYGTKNTANMQYEWQEDGTVKGDIPPNIFYGSDQYGICNNFKIEKGRDLTYLDMKNYNQVCVMGAKAATAFFGYADPVGQEVQLNGLPFLVVGTYAAKDPDSAWSQDNMVVIPYVASRVLGGGNNMTEFLVKAKSAEAAVEATSRISGFLAGIISPNQGGYNVQSDNQWQDNSNEYTTMMGLVLGGIAAISLLVGGIGIMNIMLVTVTERTREIGIRRAIGAERGSIVTQFLIEAAMICGIGGIAGIMLGTVCSVILGKLLLKMTIYPAAWITLCAFFLSVALGVLFGIFPAVKASKLQPVEALRAE
ncbi:MAG: ABC transporter permease [Oscillibacter sp.]